MKTTCAWCLNPDLEDDSDETARTFCRSHLAEFEGLSEDELDRMEDTQAFEASGE